MSLIYGWLPFALQAIAVAVLVCATGWRSRRWRLLWIPIAVLVGVALAASVYWYIGYEGLADDPAPLTFFVWLTLTGLAAAVLVLGWPATRWWRRGLSALAVPLCVLCVGLAVNLWVGYFPTVRSVWDRVTGAELPGQIDLATVAEMRRHGVKPIKGTVVSVTIPADTSGFQHRAELVYLPPAWYATNPPPRLPVVMMIGGEFGHPEDWLEDGGAQKTVDAFAAAHGGNAPVLLLVDSSGAFSNDTECVNGVRGMAADHLTKDVVPYAISNFGVSSDAANWGVAGFSTGGTCALMLTVMHPELFRAFVDIDGQFGPNAGTRQQTIGRLFGGDADAWAAFDPRTIIAKHGVYTGVSGWFAVSDPVPTVYRAASATAPDASNEPPSDAQSENHADVANELCHLGSSHGIECAVVSAPAKHYYSSAASAFADALPWLAGKLGTPGVPQIAMPGAPATP